MKAIEVVSIPVKDQSVSKEFYLKIGFELIIESPMGNGQTWVQLGLPGSSTSISLISWYPFPDVAMAPGSLKGLVILTDDIEKDVADLKAKGVQSNKIGPNGFLEGQIMDTPWGKFSHFSDPDGNGFDLHQPL